MISQLHNSSMPTGATQRTLGQTQTAHEGVQKPNQAHPNSHGSPIDKVEVSAKVLAMQQKTEIEGLNEANEEHGEDIDDFAEAPSEE
jgi:hypothetical protein